MFVIFTKTNFQFLNFKKSFSKSASTGSLWGSYQNGGDTFDDQVVPGGEDEDGEGGQQAGPLRHDGAPHSTTASLVIRVWVSLWRYRDVILSHWFDWLATWNVNLILHNHCGPRIKRKMDWPFYRWWTRICWRPGRSWGRGRRCWLCRPACSETGAPSRWAGGAGTLQ